MPLRVFSVTVAGQRGVKEDIHLHGLSQYWPNLRTINIQLNEVATGAASERRYGQGHGREGVLNDQCTANRGNEELVSNGLSPIGYEHLQATWPSLFILCGPERLPAAYRELP